MDISFNEIKGKSKIVIIVIILIVFFITTSLIFTIYSLDSQGKKDIKEYRNTQMEQTKEELKSFVYMAYTVVENNYKNATDKNYLEDIYGQRLKNLIDIVEEILKDKALSVKKGKISLSKAKAQSLALIKKMKYNNGIGYIWITDNTLPNPTMLLEPIVPELNGKKLDNKKFNYVAGTEKNIFTEITKICNEKDECFIDYVWTHPSEDSTHTEIPKFVYTRLFEEWGWIIGTGIYLDDAVKDSMKKSISDLRELRYAGGTGYFWLNDNTRPTPKLVMNPFIPHLEGKVLTDKKYNRAFGRDYNLYEAFLDACDKTGDGFVEYAWDKPLKNDIIENAPKLSFVKFFKPFGWVIGSGVYIDDIDKEINKKIESIEEQRVNLIINYLLIFFILGIISITTLIYILNRSFSSKKEDENNIEEEKVTSNVAKEEEKIEPTNVKEQSTVIEAEKLLKIFMEEQARLMVYHKAVDNNNYSSISKQMKKLVKNLKLLNEQVQVNKNQEE